SSSAWAFTLHCRRRILTRRPRIIVYGITTLYAWPFKTIRLPRSFLTPRQSGRTSQHVPQPHRCYAYRLSHTHGLASSAFARHYSLNLSYFWYLDVSLPIFTFICHIYSTYSDT